MPVHHSVHQFVLIIVGFGWLSMVLNGQHAERLMLNKAMITYLTPNIFELFQGFREGGL
jgi:hypothetical protein